MAKGNGDSKLVTQDMLMEAVDAILKGMDIIVKTQGEEQKRQLDDLRKELKKKMDSGFSATHEQIEDLDEKVDINYKSTNGKIKAMKATSVSREEFEELKEEVRRLKKSFASG